MSSTTLPVPSLKSLLPPPPTPTHRHRLQASEGLLPPCGIPPAVPGVFGNMPQGFGRKESLISLILRKRN